MKLVYLMICVLFLSACSDSIDTKNYIWPNKKVTAIYKLLDKDNNLESDTQWEVKYDPGDKENVYYRFSYITTPNAKIRETTTRDMFLIEEDKIVLSKTESEINYKGRVTKTKMRSNTKEFVRYPDVGDIFNGSDKQIVMSVEGGLKLEGVASFDECIRTGERGAGLKGSMKVYCKGYGLVYDHTPGLGTRYFVEFK